MTYHTRLLNELDSPHTRERILSLFHVNRIPDPEARYQWLYRSPFAQQHVLSVLLLHADEIVGIASVLRIPGGELTMASLVNLIVDERHRTLGPALILVKALRQAACRHFSADLIVTKPNPTSQILVRRLKFTDLGPQLRYSWVVNPARFLNLKPALIRLADTVSRCLLDPWLRIQRLSGRLQQGELNGNWRFFDDLSAHTELLTPFQVWRYADIPDRRSHLAVFGPPEPGAPCILYGLDERSSVLSINDISGAGEHHQQLLAGFMLEALARYPLRNFSLAMSNSPSLLRALTSIGYVERLDEDALNLFLTGCGDDPQSLHEKLERQGPVLFPCNIDF